VFPAAYALGDFTGRIPCGEGDFVEAVHDAGGRPGDAHHCCHLIADQDRGSETDRRYANFSPLWARTRRPDGVEQRTGAVLRGPPGSAEAEDS
jgi:hypothetical protein